MTLKIVLCLSLFQLELHFLVLYYNDITFPVETGGSSNGGANKLSSLEKDWQEVCLGHKTPEG